MLLITVLALGLLYGPGGARSTIIAYAVGSGGEGKEIAMQPNTQVEIGFYSPIMSSVPGFPFKCQGKDVVSADFVVDNGQFILWGADYRITDAGKQVSTEAGVAVYWSPLDSSSQLAQSATITITVRMKNGQTHQETIIISSATSEGSSQLAPMTYKAALK